MYFSVVSQFHLKKVKEARRTTKFLLTFNLFLVFSLTTGCSPGRHIQTRPSKSLEMLWDSLDLSEAHHIGLSVYHVKKRRFIFNYRDDNHFTPASNVKILTLNAALQYLGEKIPAAYYQVEGDSMTVWGGGDPGTKFPDINAGSTLVDHLRNTDKSIIFSDHHFTTKRYGRGWAWDDHNYSFQPERTAFPLYGNKLWIQRYGDSIVTIPSYFDLVLSIKKDTVETWDRNEWGTQYTYSYDHRKTTSITSIPVSLFENDVKSIWMEETGKDITYNNERFHKSAHIIEGSLRDTMLKRMMQESDNFVAEQLLLATSMKELGVMDERAIIRKMMKGPLAYLTDTIYWMDGSGLSRYNLLTPRSVIFVLDQILKEKGIDYIKEIFAAGGESGTLWNSYASSDGKPYIYAKTGNMRHVYCVSGILITRSGEILLFSWMNNQFTIPVIELKKRMEKLFSYLRNHN